LAENTPASLFTDSFNGLFWVTAVSVPFRISFALDSEVLPTMVGVYVKLQSKLVMVAPLAGEFRVMVKFCGVVWLPANGITDNVSSKNRTIATEYERWLFMSLS